MPRTISATAAKRYRMSFSTGGLFVRESVELARLHAEGESWDETRRRAVSDGLASLPKAASQRRTIREIVNRVACLSVEERTFLVGDADRQEQQALLWLATCRAYRFVHEFAVEVLRERYLSWRLELAQEAFDVQFDAKAEWDEDLASISASTRKKLRQVLFRIMREAGLLAADGRIQGAYLSPRLKSLIASRQPKDLLVFPGIAPDGGIS